VPQRIAGNLHQRAARVFAAGALGDLVQCVAAQIPLALEVLGLIVGNAQTHRQSFNLCRRFKAQRVYRVRPRNRFVGLQVAAYLVVSYLRFAQSLH
jgi:hypothetical protein